MKSTDLLRDEPGENTDSAQKNGRLMRRVALASLTGTTVEWYDFFIFGTAATLVFNTVFFPELGAAAGLMASLATFGVAFLARPVGTIVFGHIGDKVGRKATLVSTMMLMGFATVAIGLLPTAETAGAWAAVLLVILRLCQGLAIGGEWAGAVLLISEYAPVKQRGKFAMFPQLGIAVALALNSITFLLIVALLTDEQFLEFGWRIPFLASAVLVLVGLYVRVKIDETPAFKKLKQEKTSARIPLIDLFRTQFREVFLGAGAIMSGFTCFWIGNTYMTAYGTTQLGLLRTPVLAVGIIGAILLALSIVASAVLSDRIGRKKMIAISTCLAIPWSLCLFPVVNIGTTLAFTIGTSVTLVLYGLAYGAVGAYLPELFKSRYRYTGAGMVQSLGAIVGGAIPPLVATWLAQNLGTSAVGIYLASTSLLSLLCLAALKDTRKVDINQ